MLFQHWSINTPELRKLKETSVFQTAGMSIMHSNLFCDPSGATGRVGCFRHTWSVWSAGRPSGRWGENGLEGGLADWLGFEASGAHLARPPGEYTQPALMEPGWQDGQSRIDPPPLLAFGAAMHHRPPGLLALSGARCPLPCLIFQRCPGIHASARCPGVMLHLDV